jgi:hypothetical protein
MQRSTPNSPMAGLDIGPPHRRQLLRRGRLGTVPGIEIEAEEMHGETAELDSDVRPSRQIGHVALPVGEYLVAPAGIDPDRERRADMIEHYRRIRELPGAVRQLQYLRVEYP